MANRYANLIGTKKISEDFNNINIGFDRVQGEMDTNKNSAAAHIADSTIHVTPADKTNWNSKAAGDHIHPNATDTTAGFESPEDKAKLDASTQAPTPNTLLQRDAAGRAKVAAPSASNDIARKQEVDTVQANLDSHKADTNVHVTPADHAKLDNIEEGAEVNQNAFAQINDLIAQGKSGTIVVKGGTGITVSTSPSTGELQITATGDAAPGAHAETHMEGGADELPHVVYQIHEHEVHGLRATNGKLEYWTGTAWKTVTGGGGVALGNVIGFTAAAANRQTTLKWSDPADVVVDGITLAKWAGTRIVRKLGGYPANENDGVTVVTSSVRDQYKVTGFTDTGLTNGTTYYYMAFPFTDGDLFTVDPANRVQTVPGAVPVGNVTDFAAAAGNAQVTLKWGDPEDVVQDGVTVASWAGTKILRKLGGYPASDTDGVVVVDSAVRDQYKVTGFVDGGLDNGTTYYYAAFPRTAEGVVTVDDANRAQAMPVAVFLGNVTAFTAKAGNAQITLSWGDPPDVSEGGAVVAEWAGTKILRKVGSYPASDTDGTLVVNSTVRDQYKAVGFTDTGLTNGVTYYYAAFPYTTGGAVTIDVANRVQSTPVAFKVYGVEWDKTADTVTRIMDAVGLNRASFDTLYPWSQMRRCNLSDAGVVNAYYGDPTYKVDGTNGQCMVEIPQFWYKKEVVGTKARFYIADGPAPGYVLHPAFYRDRDGDSVAEQVDKRYYGTYLAYSNGSTVVSHSGNIPSVNRSVTSLRTQAQSRGGGWGLIDFLLDGAVQMLYLIEYANFNSQSAIGRGFSRSNAAAIATGGTNNRGDASWGEPNGNAQMSYRGIEDYYGNVSCVLDGAITDTNFNIKIGNSGFNSTGTGYTTHETSATAPVQGFISDIFDDIALGFVIKTGGGSATSKIPSIGELRASCIPTRGGHWSAGDGNGVFRVEFNKSNTDVSTQMGFRTAY